MTDIQGTEIKPGDRIAYVRNNGKYASRLLIANVVKLCAKTVAVPNTGKWGGELHYADPMKIVVLK